MDKPIISIENLSKNFKDIHAVKNLSFSVYDGDIFGFLGPNGAGKSTTLRMIVSLINFDSGNISIFGKDIKKHGTEIHRDIGCLIEKADFYSYLSARKNLKILAKISKKEISKNRIDEVLDIVGLLKRADSKVKTYSHGMRQRLGIAQALLHDPKLIILDEPSTGLDPQGMKEIRELIVSLSKNFGKTILLSSHLLNEIEVTANRMIIINKGEKAVEGSVNELLQSKIADVKFSFQDSELVIQTLSNSNWVEKVIKKEKESITFKLTRDEIPILTNHLTANSIDIFGIVPIKNLEEYFLSITNEGSSNVSVN